MFERLIYVSQARADLGSHDVYDIIRSAHNRNSRFGLTGGLVFLDGHFVQLIEGEPFRLRERFAVIAADPRHLNVEVRHSASVTDRLFPDDWMALRLHGEIDAGVLKQFDYQPGLPATAFDAQRLQDFLCACCSAAQRRSAGAG